MVNAPGPIQAPADCSLNVLRFMVKSSDVIDEEARVNVYEEKSEKVIWYKERYLGEDEIVEHIVHNATSTICWTIHRPKRGWYIRIRSRLFPPGVFIPFTPVPPASPHHADGALAIHTRTNIPVNLGTNSTRTKDSTRGNGVDETFSPTGSTASLHSYPPTPPPERPASLSSPSSSNVTLVPTQTTPTPSPLHTPSSLHTPTTRTPMHNQICEFIMAPQGAQQSKGTGVFSRALQTLMAHAPSYSYSSSFTLSRVSNSGSGASASGSAPPPYAVRSREPRSGPIPPTASALCKPLLVFHDQTPMFSVGSRSGMIEISKAEEQLVGVDTSFWVAVALTYLEFLGERESYLAALSD